MYRILIICMLALITNGLFAQKKDAVLPLDVPAKTVIATLEKDIPDLMQKADIPGMSVALIKKGKIVWLRAFGVMNANTKQSVTNNTVFEAASLTKVVVAYGAMKLIDEGKLDLDVPLNKYLGNNYEVGDDSRLDQITTRRVLSHTSGFPNWRSGEGSKLPIQFTPGEKFSYSGEGFVYLSRAIEKITDKSFNDFIQANVLDPLEMKNSSMVWKEVFSALAVHRHGVTGNVSFRNEDKSINAAASLRTTAEDYAKFMIALLNGKGLKKNTWNEMLKPQVNVDAKSPQVFWGLGVGLEVTDEGKTLWHWGDQGDSKACMIVRLEQESGIVYFANSANGLSIEKEILDDAIGGTHPSLGWLAYERYDSPGRTLLKSIIEKGAKEPLATWKKSRQNAPYEINEGQVNSIGYALLTLKKTDDAIEVFKQNTEDYPKSWNVWDSLAEAYETAGNKELAIRNYEKSLELNPENKNGEAAMKKLKQ